jgi:hypothetical protein
MNKVNVRVSGTPNNETLKKAVEEFVKEVSICQQKSGNQ